MRLAVGSFFTALLPRCVFVCAFGVGDVEAKVDAHHPHGPVSSRSRETKEVVSQFHSFRPRVGRAVPVRLNVPGASSDRPVHLLYSPFIDDAFCGVRSHTATPASIHTVSEFAGTLQSVPLCRNRIVERFGFFGTRFCPLAGRGVFWSLRRFRAPSWWRRSVLWQHVKLYLPGRLTVFYFRPCMVAGIVCMVALFGSVC